MSETSSRTTDIALEVERELHRVLHTKLRSLKYQPISIAEALRKLSTYLHTVIEIGTYMYIFSDTVVAKHIANLENTVDEVAHQLLIHMAVVVGHNVDEAWKAVPIYVYVLGVDKVMDSFKDLAMSVLRRCSPSPSVASYLSYLSDVAVVPVPGSKVEGSTTDDLEEIFSVEVLAMLRRGSWIVNPHKERIERDDIVYVKGFKENVAEMCRNLGIALPNPAPPAKDLEPVLQHIDSMIDMLALLNDLAHYQLKAQDPQLSEELLELEEFFDNLRNNVSRMIVSCPSLGVDDKVALLRLVTRLEDASDALTYIVTIPAQDEYRDVLSNLIETTDEKAAVFLCRKSVDIEKLYRALDDWGATPLAIRKGSEWIAITPYNMAKLRASSGDRVLILYPLSSEEEVLSTLRLLGLERAS